MKEKINTKDIKLARIKYFDKERNGVELSDINACVILVKVGDKFINYFDDNLIEVPVFHRTFQPNITRSGVDYGSKLVYDSGPLETGVCYIIDNTDMSERFKSEYVTIEDIEDYIINSHHFFVDRESIINKKNIPKFKLYKYYQKLISDSCEREKLNKYFADRIKGFQYNK